MRKTILVMMTAVACLTAPRAWAAELPRAQLDESERHFNRAYGYFLGRDYWAAQDYLDRALKANTYLVDYYLLSALNLQRMGEGDEARAALTGYLEVRPMDGTALRIMKGFVEQDRTLQMIVGSRPLALRWQFSQPDLQTEWRTGLTRPISIKGLGKVKALGDVLCLADTLGNQVCLRSRGEGAFRSIPVERPAAALPTGDGTFWTFGVSGDVHFFSGLPDALASPDWVGAVPSHVADAAWISASEFVVADPVSRDVAFYDSATLKPLARWTPPEGEMLFEPVAVECFADWLAGAYRGNGRVFVLNAAGRRDFFSVEVPLVRDLLWSPLGELFALTEDGNVFGLSVDLRERRAERGEPLQSGLRDIWALFASDEGDLCGLDVSGSRLMKAVMLPSQAVNQSFFGIFNPTLVMQANRESFLLDATLVSPFASCFRDAPVLVHSVWNNRSIRSAALWQEPARFEGLLLHRALPASQALPPSLRTARVEQGRDLHTALPSLWHLHRGSLTNVIVDASIPFAMEDLLSLARFCLMNGLELDVWAREVPSLALTRASAFTGGKTVFALEHTPELTAPRTRLQIQIPLPQELSSSGYPGRSMLAVYLDIGLVQTRAWMPLWPDLLERQENP